MLQPLQAGHQAHRHAEPVWLRHCQLNGKTAGDGGDQAEHDGLDTPEACALQAQHQHRVECGDGNAYRYRYAEEQVQCERTAQHFSQVGGDNRQLGPQPQKSIHARRITLTAGAGQILLRDDAKAHAKRLQQHRGQAGQQHHEQQAVAEARSGLNIGGPVTRVHVADRHQQAGAGEAQQFFVKWQTGVNHHAAFDFRRTKGRGGRAGQ